MIISTAAALRAVVAMGTNRYFCNFITPEQILQSISSAAAAAAAAAAGLKRSEVCHSCHVREAAVRFFIPPAPQKIKKS